MNTYNIECEIDNIANIRIQELMREVYKSYLNGNNRSAIVLLWTAVVCDALDKLTELKNVYNDRKAEAILAEILVKQKENNKSSEWESLLIKLVSERTEIIDSNELNDLLHIQMKRHICAHPAIENDNKLHQPHPEITKALIVTALSALISKPSLASKEIFGEILDELDVKSDAFQYDADLYKYFKLRYFDRFGDATKLQFFRMMWKVALKDDSEKAKSNRSENIYILNNIISDYRGLILDDIKAKSSTYSAQAIGFDTKRVLRVLKIHPRVYDLFDQPTKHALESQAKSHINEYINSPFLHKDFTEFSTKVEASLRSQDYKSVTKVSWKFAYSIYSEQKAGDRLINCLCDFYIESPQYNDADYRYENMIRPLLNKFSDSSLQSLLIGIDSNGQCSGRKAAKQDHEDIIVRCEKRNIPTDSYRLM